MDLVTALNAQVPETKSQAERMLGCPAFFRLYMISTSVYYAYMQLQINAYVQYMYIYIQMCMCVYPCACKYTCNEQIFLYMYESIYLYLCFPPVAICAGTVSLADANMQCCRNNATF